MSIGDGTISTTFVYDPNGNELTGNGRTATWTSYNKPASITQGSSTISFLDDPEHQRFQQVTAQGTILYFDGFGAHEELVMGSTWKWNDFLTVGNVMVGERSIIAGTATTIYFHTDHLGSISVITDHSGNVLEWLSYDAWGKRRFANGADDPSGSITSQTTRGFTNQEELGVGGLVHLNGRIYDPMLGRMTSADPTVPDPLNAQAWNRYSYVGNDPLTFTDPTGFSWLTHFFHAVASFLQANPLVRSVLQIGITTLLCSIPGVNVILMAMAGAAIATGLAGGHILDVMKAAAIAGATAVAFMEVGDLTGFHDVVKFSDLQRVGIQNLVLNVAGHAAVGCMSAVVSGGRCGAGAIAGAAGAASSPLVNQAFPDAQTNLGQRLEGSAVSGTIGGLASLAGGGKFEDGAVTAAFGYLFNDVALSCRDAAGGAASHCGLFVFSPGSGSSDTTSSDYFAQYSLGKGDITFNQTPSTIQKDYANFASGDYIIVPPPAGMSQQDFDQAVMKAADSYQAPYYSPIAGPNSNSAAGFPIIISGGQIPRMFDPSPFGGYNSTIGNGTFIRHNKWLVKPPGAACDFETRSAFQWSACLPRLS